MSYLPPKNPTPRRASADENRVGDDPGLPLQKASQLIQIGLHAVDARALDRQLRLRLILNLLDGLAVPEKEQATPYGRAHGQPDGPRRGEPYLVAHDAPVRAVVRREAEAGRVAEQVEGEVAVAAPQRREQCVRVELLALFEQGVVAYDAEAALIRVELEVEDFLAGLLLQGEADVRVRVVAGQGEDAPPGGVDLVPALQVRVRPLVEVREEEIGVREVRPEAVEEEQGVVDLLRVRVEVIDLHGVVAARLEVAHLFGVADDGEPAFALRAFDEPAQGEARVGEFEAGGGEETPAVGGRELAAGDEEDALVRAAERRLRGLEEGGGVLGHQDEGEAVGLRGADDLFERASAVAAERGVDVEDAGVVF